MKLHATPRARSFVRLICVHSCLPCRILRNVRLWNVETGELLRVFSQSVSVAGGAFSPDGRYLLTTGVGIVQLWDAETGGNLRIFSGSPDAILSSVAFSPDGKHVVAGGSEGQLWDTTYPDSIPDLLARWPPDISPQNVET